MSELKSRSYITPSSLASYFGCGFNSPEDQFLIDSGEMVADFDEDAKLRMELGNYLENSVTDYFQNVVFKVPILERNTDTRWGYDDKIKYRIDGKLVLDEPVVYENKISNSQSYKFTENRGYLFQVQAYMLCEGTNKAILAGLYQGKPIWKMIQRNDEMIEDIKVMTDFVVSALNGVSDFYAEFPVHLLEKYSNTKLYEPVTDLSKRTVDYLHKLGELNEKKKEIEKEIKLLNDEHADDFELTAGTYEDEKIKVTVSHWMQKGGFDLDKFITQNPFLDLSDYYKPDTERSKMTIKVK